MEKDPTMHIPTYLSREEESALQRSGPGQAVEAYLRCEWQGDIEPASVGTGMHIARRVHGVAVGNLRATFPVKSNEFADGIICLGRCMATSVGDSLSDVVYRVNFLVGLLPVGRPR